MSRSLKDSDFERRVRELYSTIPLDGPFLVEETQGAVLHRAEIKAMSDAYLGESYDQAKVEKIIELQVRLRSAQDRLDEMLEDQRISKAKYLELFETCQQDIFSRCERVLGEEDFKILFGCPRDQATHFIERDTFLRQFGR